MFLVCNLNIAEVRVFSRIFCGLKLWKASFVEMLSVLSNIFYIERLKPSSQSLLSHIHFLVLKTLDFFCLIEMQHEEGFFNQTLSRQTNLSVETCLMKVSDLVLPTSHTKKKKLQL
uniref:Uncharacterized protein n=1 Tax=Cacopsylla melanoneura TaxID=428564 RepID=A0A8D9F7A8_9HEMI